MPAMTNHPPLIVPASAVRVFIWFAANEDTRTTHRLIVTAVSLDAARRQADQLPISEDFKHMVMAEAPTSVYEAPTAIYDVSREGKAFSVVTGMER